MSSGNNNLTGNTADSNIIYGICFVDSSKNNVANNTAVNSNRGIFLLRSGESMVSGNMVSNNGNGIRISSGRNSNIFGNDVSNNNVSGISLFNSDNCTITENILLNNTIGIDLDFLE